MSQNSRSQARSAARLGAVQALYQQQMEGTRLAKLLDEFVHDALVPAVKHDEPFFALHSSEKRIISEKSTPISIVGLVKKFARSVALLAAENLLGIQGSALEMSQLATELHVPFKKLLLDVFISGHSLGEFVELDHAVFGVSQGHTTDCFHQLEIRSLFITETSHVAKPVKF